jgi:hypothetical protein
MKKYPIWIKFSRVDIQKNAVQDCEFHEYWHSGRRALLESVKERGRRKVHTGF